MSASIVYCVDCPKGFAIPARVGVFFFLFPVGIKLWDFGSKLRKNREFKGPSVSCLEKKTLPKAFGPDPGSLCKCHWIHLKSVAHPRCECDWSSGDLGIFASTG